MRNIENKIWSLKNFLLGVQNVYGWSKNHINYRMGTLGAFTAGPIAFCVNYSHGILPAFGAFGKQSGIAFIVGGLNTKTCQKMATKFKSKPLSLVAATVVATAQAGAIIYGVHEVSGTPEALNTALALSALNAPAFFGLGYYYRKKQDSGEGKGLFIQS